MARACKTAAVKSLAWREITPQTYKSQALLWIAISDIPFTHSISTELN